MTTTEPEFNLFAVRLLAKVLAARTPACAACEHLWGWHDHLGCLACNCKGKWLTTDATEGKTL